MSDIGKVMRKGRIHLTSNKNRTGSIYKQAQTSAGTPHHAATAIEDLLGPPTPPVDPEDARLEKLRQKRSTLNYLREDEAAE